MPDISTILNKLKATDTDAIAEKAMVMCTDELVSLNKKQLYSGFDRDGKRLMQYRSAVYSEVKHRMNPQPGEGNPDLYKSGSYYRGMFAKVSSGEITMGSSDEKDKELEIKYGDEIRGLGGNFKADFIDNTLQPAFVATMKKELSL